MQELIKTTGTMVWRENDEALIFNANNLSLIWANDPDVIYFLQSCDESQDIYLLKQKLKGKYEELLYPLQIRW